MRNTPAAIFAIGALLVTGTLAWILRSLIHIGRAAARFPKETP